MVIPVTKPAVTPLEQKYREELFPDVKEIKNKNLLCTSCGGSVKDLITKGKPISHPFLETLLCEKCHKFYGDGEFSVDEDGSDKYCRWCGQGGTLFLCSQCTSGFCKKCVKRNLPKSAMAKIEEDDWVCYCCDTVPLYELRAQSWAAQQYAAHCLKAKASSKGSKRRESSKRLRDTENGESGEEADRKKKRRVELKVKGDKKQRNGDEKVRSEGKERGRSLRKRNRAAESSDSGGESEACLPDTLPSGISVKRIRAAINKLSGFVADIAGMTKEAHKKLLECKTKKLNLKNINTLESVVDTQRKFSSMMITLETNVQMVRKGLEEYVEEWTKMVQQDMKAIEEEDDESTAKLENGLLSENVGGKQSEVMEVDNEIPKSDPNKEIEAKTSMETDSVDDTDLDTEIKDSELKDMKSHENSDLMKGDSITKIGEQFDEYVGGDKERISLEKDVEDKGENYKVKLKEVAGDMSEEKSNTEEMLKTQEIVSEIKES